MTVAQQLQNLIAQFVQQHASVLSQTFAFVVTYAVLRGVFFGLTEAGEKIPAEVFGFTPALWFTILVSGALVYRSMRPNPSVGPAAPSTSTQTVEFAPNSKVIPLHTKKEEDPEVTQEIEPYQIVSQ